MSVPQIIVTLANNGDLIAELPGNNGSRRKLELTTPQNFSNTISNTILALQAVRDLSELNILASEASQKAANSKEKDKTELTRKARIARDRANLAAHLAGDINQTINSLENLLKKDETIVGILSRILQNQLEDRSNLGEDGAPTAHQLNHWKRHETFSDPSCPFCISEGRFEPGKNREKAIRNLSIHEALKLGLISRGYKQSRNNPEHFTLGKITATIINNQKLQDNHKVFWSKSQLNKLIQDGKAYAKLTGFEPQEFKQKTTRLGSGVSVKKSVQKVQDKKSIHDKIKLSDLSF